MGLDLGRTLEFIEEDQSVSAIDAASSFEDLIESAMTLYNPPGVGTGSREYLFISAPITENSFGSREENIAHLSQAISHLRGFGVPVFNQLLFDEAALRIVRTAGEDGYPYAALDQFYLPIFESGIVRDILFIRGWQESYGARWEYQQSSRLGIRQRFFHSFPITHLKHFLW